ncbi:DUF2149 domain-containing protein [Undibacterium baiyunense]|uniref:DUF2149 domain-containing protein n=1 Tax=Undibacterium baiyunense TaxID=2828731 RepID=A0A941I0G3_9BURK|nr:DUF2149 domain-containing protein [Undibacterium baiyunense]MBR7745208.1 DUF2149 domain-containing protein [Undibacterium baiyunense]
MKLLHEPESDDPILSVVNLIDVFLVLIAALLIVVAKNPILNAFAKTDVTVISNAGKSNMEILVKQGQKIERYKSNGQAGQGEGAKAGTAYRLKDGSIIYVPEDDNAKQSP